MSGIVELSRNDTCVILLNRLPINYLASMIEMGGGWVWGGEEEDARLQSCFAANTPRCGQIESHTSAIQIEKGEKKKEDKKV